MKSSGRRTRTSGRASSGRVRVLPVPSVRVRATADLPRLGFGVGELQGHWEHGWDFTLTRRGAIEGQPSARVELKASGARRTRTRAPLTQAAPLFQFSAHDDAGFWPAAVDAGSSVLVFSTRDEPAAGWLHLPVALDAEEQGPRGWSVLDKRTHEATRAEMGADFACEWASAREVAAVVRTWMREWRI